MKAYVIATGTVFGLITVAHILRMLQERPGLAEQPWYIAITLVAAGLCLWACCLLWRARRP
jgi:hypothetical protein